MLDKQRIILRRKSRSAILAKSKSLGFTLLELGLATVIATVATAGALYSQQRDLRASVGSAQGAQLAKLATALNIYTNQYYTQISNGQAIPYTIGSGNVSNNQAPTFADLQNLQLVDVSSSPVSLYGGAQYRFQITKSPAGCVAGTCILSALVYIPTPITDPVSGSVDMVAIGQAMIAGGGYVGSTSTSDNTTLYGYRNGWTTPNPMSGTDGILAAEVSYGATTDSYLRRDGSNFMIGSLNMNGNDVTAANNLTAQNLTSNGMITAASALIRSGAQVQGTLQAANVLVADQFGVSGTIQSGALAITTQSTAGTSCSYNGTVQKDSTGQLLVCKNGVMTQAAGGGGLTAWTKSFAGQCQNINGSYAYRYGYGYSYDRACINQDGSVSVLNPGGNYEGGGNLTYTFFNQVQPPYSNYNSAIILRSPVAASQTYATYYIGGCGQTAGTYTYGAYPLLDSSGNVANWSSYYSFSQYNDPGCIGG